MIAHHYRLASWDPEIDGTTVLLTGLCEIELALKRLEVLNHPRVTGLCREPVPDEGPAFPELVTSTTTSP